MPKKDIKSIRQENKLNKEKPDNSVKWVVWSFILLLFIVWCLQYGKATFSAVFLSLGQNNQTVTIEQTPVEIALSHIRLTSSYKVVDINSQKNLYMNIQIDNNHDKDIKDFEIQCSANYGVPTEQKLKVTVLQTVSQHSTLLLKDYNFGSLHDTPNYVNCSLTDLVLK